jgi:hypothetical protein
LRPRHAGTEPGSRNDDKDLHNWWSIQREAASF